MAGTKVNVNWFVPFSVDEAWNKINNNDNDNNKNMINNNNDDNNNDSLKKQVCLILLKINYFNNKIVKITNHVKNIIQLHLLCKKMHYLIQQYEKDLTPNP